MRCASVLKQVKCAGLALEALGCLFFARCGLIFLPVRLIAPYFASESHLEENPRATEWVVAWIGYWARYVPWRSKCLEQAIASKLMLRRRGYASLLHLGVKKEKGAIIAHAWLEGGDSGGFFALNYSGESL